MKNTDSDDDMPELEDFSNDLEKIKNLNRIKSSSIPVNVINSTTSQKDTNKTSIEEKNKNKPTPINEPNKSSSREESFGLGFKKGFLKRANQQKNPNNSNIPNKENTKNPNTTKNEPPSTNTPIDLTHIKSKPDEKYKIDEVQKNISVQKEFDSKYLKPDLLKNKDQWLNQELLMKLAKNPRMVKVFMNPEFTNIISLLQTNPQEAKRKYGNNPEFNEFFKEFSLLMADHFENLSKKQPENPVLNDPEVKILLQDPEVNKFIKTIEKEGRIDYALINSNPELGKKIEKLVEKGVLKKEFQNS